MPAFVGNRVGFKVLNETAQLAAEHGVAYIDYLIGPHTGRAMAPLATVDLVGWDVHKAIVDNVHANCKDEAHGFFAMPAFMNAALARGHAWATRRPNGAASTAARAKTVFVLDPKTGGHEQARRSPRRSNSSRR